MKDIGTKIKIKLDKAEDVGMSHALWRSLQHNNSIL